MRYLLIIIAFVAVLALPRCKDDPERHKKGAWEACNRAWKDSGLTWRLSPYKAYMNSDTIGYACQVNVNGRWIDEVHVKMEPK